MAGRRVRPDLSDQVHQVVNCSDSPAVSLDVYAPRLRTMTRYAVANGPLEVAGISRAGEDW